jgi:hopanoid biosynthesis associated RND transporter like protein HpnN
MLASWVTSVVRFCIRFPWPIIALGIIGSAISGVYSVRHFAITTDINKLISPDLDWRKREAEFEKAFPGHFGSTLLVVNAPTAEFAARASADLVSRLKAEPRFFQAVDDIEGSDFFARNGLLFRSTDDVANMAKGLGQAAPLIGTLAGDPSLRGMTRALSLGLIGVQNKMVTLDALARPLSMASATVEDVLANRQASFSWLSMLNGQDPKPDDLRRLIEVRPVLDFSALQPGKASSDEIRSIANELQLKDKYQARVRLTGSVPMADEEFGSVQDGALENAIGTIIVVLTILWLALRSPRIILAVIINLFVGLTLTAAIGLAMVGALNMISVAFAVLFVGLGVDFGIQFAVRYRAERHDVPKLNSALTRAAEKIGVPLTLAAAAVAAGFMSFLPTHYRGVSELGQIAGMGMLIAFATSITLLPALITLLKPEGEPEEIGYRVLAPVDRFLETHRIPVIVGTLAVAVLGSPLLYYLTFDFDPIHLRSPQTESISTLLELGGDPRAGVNSVNIIFPSLDEAAAAAEKLQKLPEVSQVSTLMNFVPQDQEKKLATIQDLGRRLGQSLQPSASGKPPTDAENVAALKGMADQLTKIAGNASGPGADAARRLAAAALKLSEADEATRMRAQAAFVVPLQTSLGQLRGFLTAQRVTKENLPQSLRRLWVTPDGRARVEASPRAILMTQKSSGHLRVRFLPSIRTDRRPDFNS